MKHAAFVEEAAGQLDAGVRRLEVLGVQACRQERVARSVREREPVRPGCPKRSKSFAWATAVKLEILINRTELGVFSALRASHLPQAEGLLGDANLVGALSVVLHRRHERPQYWRKVSGRDPGLPGPALAAWEGLVRAPVCDVRLGLLREDPRCQGDCRATRRARRSGGGRGCGGRGHSGGWRAGRRVRRRLGHRAAKRPASKLVTKACRSECGWR